MNADMIHFAKMAVRMYAETHPRPSHVTQKQGAEMLGISATTMSKLVKARIEFQSRSANVIA